jgi:hypothetical protein
VYTTAPPRKYAEAPGTANNAAAMSPPVDDSAVATVSWRAIRRLAIVSAEEQCVHGAPRPVRVMVMMKLSVFQV